MHILAGDPLNRKDVSLFTFCHRHVYRYALVLFVSGGLHGAMSQDRAVTLSGYITDRSTGEALTGDTVLDLRSGRVPLPTSMASTALPCPATA